MLPTSRLPEIAAHFATAIIDWQLAHGRHDLPWQQADSSGYRVLVSELMLQQTQVTTVIPYFLRFIERFGDFAALASAKSEAVTAAWAGLGYYRRAHHLHQAAKAVVARHGGQLPRQMDELLALPGVGLSTAAALAVFTHGQRAAILDGNVIRILCRYFALGESTTTTAMKRRLFALAEALLPDRQLVPYTQGLMDLGSLVCRRSQPECQRCPLSPGCLALAADAVHRYPAAKRPPQRPKTDLSCVFAEYQGRYWLERRPPTGIWGGLLAPLICDQAAGVELGEQLERWAKHYGWQWASRAHWRVEPVVTHLLTHRRLHLYVMTITVAGLANDPLDEHWFTPQAALDAGLPQPFVRYFKKQSL